MNWSAEWLLLLAVSLHKHMSSASQWSRYNHVTRNFLINSWQRCCIVHFMNASILLLSSFAIYILLALKIAGATILYSCKVVENILIVTLKNSLQRFTDDSRRILYLCFWWSSYMQVQYSPLYYLLLIICYMCNG